MKEIKISKEDIAELEFKIKIDPRLLYRIEECHCDVCEAMKEVLSPKNK